MPKVTPEQFNAAAERHCHRIEAMLNWLQEHNNAARTAPDNNWGDIGSLQHLERILVDYIICHDQPGDRDLNEDAAREALLEKIDPEGEAYFSPITIEA